MQLQVYRPAAATRDSVFTQETLAPGIEHETTFTVTRDMAPPHLPVVVRATPIMVGRIENTRLESVAPHLDEGETTVGTHVCVSHTGAAREGEEVAAGPAWPRWSGAA